MIQLFALFFNYLEEVKELNSSVSIVSGYRLDDQTIEFRSPAEAKDFSSSLCVQTGSGANPASCTVGTGGPLPRDKVQLGRGADPHLVPRSRMSRSYTSSPPPSTFEACSGTAIMINVITIVDLKKNGIFC
jgi:hypothetical protein